MRTYVFLLSLMVTALFFVSCETGDTNSPATQEIVYSDTSSLTGELSVEVLYYDDFSHDFKPAPSGTDVYLFATFEDLQNNLPIYYLQTSGNNSLYFGFINYGNYYVLAMNGSGFDYYEGVSVVQVRPRRQEWLTLTMYETQLK